VDLAHPPELVLEMTLSGIEPHGLGQFGSGIFDPSLSEEHHSEPGVPVGTVGLQSKCI